MKDLVEKIMEFEAGKMEEEKQVIEFFQELINTGLAWSMQGAYGRQARALIEAGACTI